MATGSNPADRKYGVLVLVIDRRVSCGSRRGLVGSRFHDIVEIKLLYTSTAKRDLHLMQQIIYPCAEVECHRTTRP